MRRRTHATACVSRTYLDERRKRITTKNELLRPLDQAELDELAAFLGADELSDERMPAVASEGFLTAIISSPEIIMPSEWLPPIIGDEPFATATLEEAQRVLTLIMRLNNDVSATLRDGTFVPAIGGDTTGVAQPGAATYVKVRQAGKVRGE